MSHYRPDIMCPGGANTPNTSLPVIMPTHAPRKNDTTRLTAIFYESVLLHYCTYFIRTY